MQSFTVAYAVLSLKRANTYNSLPLNTTFSNDIYKHGNIPNICANIVPLNKHICTTVVKNYKQKK
jgi:hypothetical protein